VDENLGAQKARYAQCCARSGTVAEMYPELNDDLETRSAFLDTYDTLTDWYQHFRTLRQIQRTLERLGLADICCNKAGNGVEARGRRPH